MAQHDYVIDNDTAANVRSDLNDALAAIVSQNSGASAPSPTYANMLWYDSSNNILKMRSEADDAWLNIGYLDQSANAFRILDDTQVVNTSGTQTGLLGDQTTSTWETGTSTTESLVSPAKVKSAIDSLGGGAVTVEEVIEITGSEAVIDIAFNGSGNDTYQIEMCSVKPSGDNVQLRARTSTDGGATFDSGSSDYGFGTGGMGTQGSAAYMNLGQAATGGATEDTGLSGSVWVHAPHVNAATMLTTVQVQQNYIGAVRDSIGGAFRKSNQSVDAIRLFWETGNFGSGVIVVKRTKSV